MAGVEVATAYVSIVPNTQQLARDLNGSAVTGAGTTAGKKIGLNLGTALASAGVAAAATAAVAIGKTLVDGVNNAIALDEAANKVDVVFEGAAGSVRTFAQQGAKALGMSEGAALEAAGTFGNLLTATGVTEGAAANMSTTMVQLAADLASFNNSSPQEALDALRSGLAGETEPLKRFGVNLNDALLRQEALEQGIYDGVGVLTPAQKAQAAYGIIMGQTAKAQGDFVRTSDGAANKQKVIAAQWEDITTKIGGMFLPVVDDALTAVSDLLTLFDGDGLASFIPPEVQTQLGTLKDSLVGLGQTVMPTIREWYDSYIKPTFDKIAGAFAPIERELVPTVTAVVDFFKEAWPEIARVVDPVMEGISTMIGGVMSFIAGIIRAVMGVIRGDWDAAWEGIKTAVGGVVDFISGSMVGAVIRKAFEGVKKIGPWFADMKSAAVQRLRDVVDYVRSIPGRILSAIGNLGSLLYSAGSDVVRGLWDGIKAMGGWLTSKVWDWVRSVLPEPVLKALGIASPSKLFRDIGKEVPRGLALGIMDTTSQAKSAVLSLAGAVSSPFGSTTPHAYAPSGSTMGHTFNFYNTSRADIPYIESAVRKVLRDDVRGASLAYGGI